MILQPLKSWEHSGSQLVESQNVGISPMWTALSVLLFPVGDVLVLASQVRLPNQEASQAGDRERPAPQPGLSLPQLQDLLQAGCR